MAHLRTDCPECVYIFITFLSAFTDICVCHEFDGMFFDKQTSTQRMSRNIQGEIVILCVCVLLESFHMKSLYHNIYFHFNIPCCENQVENVIILGLGGLEMLKCGAVCHVMRIGLEKFGAVW